MKKMFKKFWGFLAYLFTFQWLRKKSDEEGKKKKKKKSKFRKFVKKTRKKVMRTYTKFARIMCGLHPTSYRIKVA
jgi:hypothetical protein